MDRKELVDRYFLAWNDANLTDLLRLLHPQASYYDAFWGETCSGGDLAKYLGANLEMEMSVPVCLHSLNRYTAYHGPI